MTKATVSRLFIGSLIAAVAGAIIAIAAVWLALENGVFVMNGPDLVGIQGSALAWILVGSGIVGAVTFTGGMIGGLVSWIGALLNTSRLESKRWFLALLVLGIFDFGFFAMIAYLLAGPDGSTVVRQHASTAVATA